MSSSEDPEHAYEASEDSENAAHASPDNLPLGPLLGHMLFMKTPGRLSALDSHDDVRMAFETFKRVVSPDDFSELTCATLDGLSTDSLTTQDATIALEKINSMLASLINYSKIIASICRDGRYLPLVWAPAHLFLKLSITLAYPEVYKEIVEVYIRATKQIEISVNDQIVFKDHSGLVEMLAIIYADIIKFHIQVYEVVRENNSQHRISKAWANGQPHIDSIINDLEAHRNIFDDRVYTAEQKIYEDLFLEGIDTYRLSEITAQYLVIHNWLEADETEQSRLFHTIVSGISKPFFPHNWLLHHPTVEDWLTTSTCPAFLVLEGHPGSGKTVFATQLVAILRARHKESLVLCHFCSYVHPSSTKYSEVVKSIILQIYRLSPALTHDLGIHRWGSSIREDALGDHLRTMIASPSFQPENPFYVILDGVDECDDITQVLLIRLLREIDHPSLKVFVSGRVLSPQALEEVKYHREDMEVNVISLIDEKGRIERSIRRYAVQRLEALRQDNFQIGVKNSDIQDMALSIAEKADGMFFWARVVLDRLVANKSLSKRHQVQAIIDYPPIEIVPYVEQRFEGERSFIRMNGVTLGPAEKLAIGWIVNSREPLTVDELVDAIQLSSDPGELEPSEMKEFGIQMLSYVHYMVHDKPSGTIRIPLRSVYLYLQHKVATDWVPDIDAIIGRTCIAYLSRSVFKTGPCLSIPDFKARLESYPLYAYAAKHWGHHASKAAGSDLQRIVDFLDQDVLVHSAYQAMKGVQWWYSQELETRVTGLHLAAFFGLETVVRAMLKPWHDTSTAKDSLGRTPLDWAIEEEHEAVAKLLWNHDTVAISDSNEFQQGNLSKPKFHPQNGHDPTERRARNRTRLHEAARNGDKKLLVKLLDEGASINAKDSNGETALNLAVRMRRTEVTNLLIEHSASTIGITATGLSEIFEEDGSDIIHLAQSRAGKIRLNFLSDSDMSVIDAKVKSTIQNINERHLFVFNEKSTNLWEADWFPRFRPENELIFTEEPPYVVSREGNVHTRDENIDTRYGYLSRYSDVYRYSASFLFPVGETTEGILYDMFGQNPGKARIGVSWAMAKSQNAFSGSRLEPTVYLSNMPQVFIPGQQLRLVIQLIESLKTRWLEVCQEGQNRLQKWREEIMRESGNDLNLLKRLMYDAQKWAAMRQLLQRHAHKTISFGESYNRHYFEVDAMDELKKTVQDLQDSIGKQLDSLDSTYENLIQMESNLISLREAKQSNSTSRSMKRLSWITFIFLPATFSASLFGMNVNLLEDNPDWRWFILIGGIFLSLTFIGWLIFKFSELEDGLEKVANKVFKRPKPHSDAEKGTKST